MRVDRGEGQRGRFRLDRHTGRIAIDIMSRRGLASRSCTSRGQHSPVSELFDMWTGPRVGKKKQDACEHHAKEGDAESPAPSAQ